MAFRRRRDEWDDFLQRHGAELEECGIPDYVVRDKPRFLVFLDHGYDEWGWAKHPHAFFDSRVLSDEQITQLAEVVATHIDEHYRVPIQSRWERRS